MSALQHETPRVPTMDEIRAMLPAGDREDFDQECTDATPNTIQYVADKWWAFAMLFSRPGFTTGVQRSAW